MIIVDASVVVELLLNTPASRRIAGRIFATGESLHAPHLLDIEVVQVLRRYTLSGRLDSGRGLQAVEDLASFPATRYPHNLLLQRIWELRHNLTAYDATYVALAEALGAPLLTRDGSLARAPGLRASIELI